MVDTYSRLFKAVVQRWVAETGEELKGEEVQLKILFCQILETFKILFSRYTGTEVI